MPKRTFWQRLKLAYLVFKRGNQLKFDPITAIEYHLDGVYPSEADQVLRGVKLIGFDANGKRTENHLGI